MEQNRSKTTKLKLGRGRGADLIFVAIGAVRRAPSIYSGLRANCDHQAFITMFCTNTLPMNRNSPCLL